MLEEVKGTYHDVRRLEASILELHKMFMDLALLVDRQGEMLDQIEYQVSRKPVFCMTPRVPYRLAAHVGARLRSGDYVLHAARDRTWQVGSTSV